MKNEPVVARYPVRKKKHAAAPSPVMKNESAGAASEENHKTYMTMSELDEYDDLMTDSFLDSDWIETDGTVSNEWMLFSSGDD